jgi:glycosyltransferase involved in cell wall biosynthesis
LKFPWTISGISLAKLALVVNWLYLWFSPYQIIHSTYYFRGYLWRRPGTKHVVTLHDMIPEDFPEEFPNGSPHYQKESFLRDADRIVCVSNYTQSRLNYHYPELAHKAIVISSGINIPDTEILPSERDSTILYVGRREGYKDFATLLRALPSIVELYPNAQLLAVGDQKFSPSEISLISSLGLSGKVRQVELSDADLQSAYRTCCLTVVTSKVEGFGLPVIEAMINGSLVVATDIPVFREISEGAYVTFKPSDDHDLSLKIRTILQDPSDYNELRENGKKIASQYSWKNVFTALNKLYVEM